MADEFTMARIANDPWGDLAYNRKDKKIVTRIARRRVNQETAQRVRQADVDNETEDDSNKETNQCMN